MYEPTLGSCSTSHTSKTKEISWNDWWSGQCWFYFLKRQFFSSGSFVVHLRQRSSDQDDHKGKKPYNETCFQNPTELLLIGCSIESIWTPRSKSNTLTPKTNSQTCWPSEISHVMSGIIFCICSTLAISAPSTSAKWCRKETQEDAGEERVTAKSKPMMNLVLRCSVRNPDVLAYTASESLGKTRYESQIPVSSWTEQQPRTPRPVMDACSSTYSEWNTDEKWSSQEWKSDEVVEARTVRPVSEQPADLFTQHTDRFVIDDDDMDSNTVTESDLSLNSRSLVHRVNVIECERCWTNHQKMQYKTVTNIL